MTGHRPFSELTRTFTPERRARVAAKAACLREAMTLEELRKALALSQEDMAETLTGGPARRGKARKARRHACEQSAPHRRSPRRRARNHCAFSRRERRADQYRRRTVRPRAGATARSAQQSPSR